MARDWKQEMGDTDGSSEAAQSAQLEDIIPASEAEETVAFTKLKKAEKADELARLFQDASAREALGLSRDQAAAIDAWLPEELVR